VRLIHMIRARKREESSQMERLAVMRLAQAMQASTGRMRTTRAA